MGPLLYFKIWLIKSIFYLSTAFKRTIKPAPPSTRPTLLKAYPVRPNLQNRIFIPHTYAKTGGLLPLYLDVHGGGFALLDPEIDDEFCSYFANTFGVLVVSINYYKAPLNRFPGPVEDVAAIAAAIINDDSLPIDKTRVAVGGFSAGANMSLAITQRPELHRLISTAVCYYPPTDFSLDTAGKLATRLVAEKPDPLAAVHPLFQSAYVADDIDTKHPLLSPLYAKREDLPKWIYVIGAEEDMLCVEGRAMAEAAAGLASNARGSASIDGVSQDDGWEEGTVRWELVRSQGHNFTHQKKPLESAETTRRVLCEALYARTHDWLRKGAWA